MTAQERFLLRRGEPLTLEASGRRLMASLESSTQATYSLGNRAYFFQGLCQTGGIVGDYLTRELDGLTYLLETIQPEPPHTAIQKIYLAQCNASVRIERQGEPQYDAYGDPVESAGGGWETLAEHIKVYRDTTPRSDKQVSDGRLDQSIYLMHIPHRFGIIKGDRIVANGRRFRVEAVNDTLTPIDNALEGVDVAQLSVDVRGAYG